MRSAVIVLTWNAADAALNCLGSLAALDPAADQIVVVDNGSADGTADLVAGRFPSITLIRNDRNLGFSGGMNVGIRALLAQDQPPEAIILLNQDTLVDAGWLAALTAPLEADPAIGAVGCKIRYPDGSLQHAGVTLDWPRAVAHHIGWHEADVGQHDVPRDLAFITGAALALRVDAVARVGLLDEGYAPAYFEDVDLCWRIRRAGYRLHYEPRATLIHQESLSLRDELTRSAHYNRGRMRFVLKTYALADLLGAFAEAERAFIRQHAHTAEGRALRWAYAGSLDALPDILAARRDLGVDTPVDAPDSIRDLLVGLRRELAHTLRRRAASCADTIASL
ncbi:glycosyltransferase family 2 protein [Chloroflexales bacterium ZM16-3]|nr:glycosyltransferase family 2 protein [Chloroflexales bacterium ZM16-3]